MNPVRPSGLEVAVYLVIAEPPFAGAVKGIFAVVPVRVTVPMVGAAGTFGVVMEFDVAELSEFPSWFLATTVNV
jgi:hypothetical protein